jgi:gliding motility-associated-like protein
MKALIIPLLLFSFFSQAGIKKSVKSGTWSDPTVWGGKKTNFIPSQSGDTIIVNHYILLDKPLNFTKTVLSITGKGTLCGLLPMNFNDGESIFFNDGSINVTDLLITRGRADQQNTVVSINNGSITYLNTYTNPGASLFIYLDGNQPIQNRYGCTNYSLATFSSKFTQGCRNTCLSVQVPPDVIQSGTQYSWVISDTQDHPFSGTSTTDVCYTENTTVTVKLITTNGDVSDTLYKDVIVYVSPDLFLKISNDTSICDDQKAHLTSQHSPNSIVWWHPNNRLSCYNCSSPIFTPQKGDTVTTVIAYTTNGGCTSYDTLTIDIIKNEKNFLRDTIICKQGMLIIPSIYGPSNVVWNDGSTLPFINISESGQYWSTINNACGTKTDTAYVKYILPKTYIVPNVFTPNGDGVNEVFEITGVETYDQVKLSIFNRWGGKLYESTNPDAVKWDGRTESEGVYFYNLETKDCSNIKKRNQGIVEIIR